MSSRSFPAALVTLGLVAGFSGAGMGTGPRPVRALSEPDTVHLGDLPLNSYPAPPGPLLAVVLSGDGGWAGGDKGMAAAFVQQNVAVVGFDSPRYLERTPSPDQAAADLARILRHYLDTWQRQRVIIVGYSRGADIAPFMVSRLPADLRRRIALVTLLGPGPWARFAFSELDILHAHVSSGLPVAAEVAKLRGSRILCIQGASDRTAICPSLAQAGLARAVVRPGGHVVRGHDAPGVVETVLSAVQLPIPSGALSEKRLVE